MSRTLALPPSPGLLALVVVAFVLPGLVGHDPWKTADAIGIEIVHQMRVTGDWLVPRIAGEPWLEDPPLYHWCALVFAVLTGWLLQFHDAVRLASGLFLVAACGFLYSAARGLAREADRATAGAAAVLLLVGAMGLFVHAHEALPDHAALAGACAGFAALVHFPRRPFAAGAAFGVALATAFLSTAIVVPVALYLAALASCAACPEWRSARHFGALLLAGAVMAALAAAWPLALASHHPELARSWWALVVAERDFIANLRYFLGIAPWFTWPAWPLAVWALWSQRRDATEPRLFLPLAATLFTLAAAARFTPQQDINALVLLPPLALLGAQGVAQLRRGAAAALDWFGVMTFTFFALGIWLGYVAMMTGVPPKIANNFAKLAPGFVVHFSWLPFIAALALSGAWGWLLVATPRGASRGVLRWSAGLALLWGLFAMLIMPWADYQKTYRGVAEQIAAKLPANAGCVSGRNLGISQRSMLSYHAGLTIQQPPARGRDPCRYLLVVGHPRDERDPPGAGWQKLADVGRPGDKAERYRLYQRSAR